MRGKGGREGSRGVAMATFPAHMKRIVSPPAPNPLRGSWHRNWAKAVSVGWVSRPRGSEGSFTKTQAHPVPSHQLRTSPPRSFIEIPLSSIQSSWMNKKRQCRLPLETVLTHTGCSAVREITPYEPHPNVTLFLYSSVPNCPKALQLPEFFCSWKKRESTAKRLTCQKTKYRKWNE